MRLPIPLRLLLAAQPKLVRPVLEVVHRVITRHLLGQAGVKADEAHSVAVTLIQCFGSAANIHLHRRRPARARVAYSQLAHGSCSIDEFDQLPHLARLCHPPAHFWPTSTVNPCRH